MPKKLNEPCKRLRGSGPITYGSSTTAWIAGNWKKSSHEKYPAPFPFTVVSAGTLIARKGFDFPDPLVCPFSRTLPRSPRQGWSLPETALNAKSWKLWLLDSTSAKKSFSKGFLQNPYPLMKTSDVFVSASKSEGLSNALLEGMFLECVPVSTFSGGADEIIEDGENGFLVDYGDQEKLAAILGELYRNPASRRSIASAARRTASQKFSISGMKQEILDFCTETRSKKQDT